MKAELNRLSSKAAENMPAFGSVNIKALFFLGLVVAATQAPAHQPQAGSYDNPTWMEPIQPFRIASRIYYVGSRELSAFLIDSGAGLILLDAGVPEFAPRLLANIRALGFDPKQVRILLNSQAHLDHAGGLAAIKAATGARMLASAGDAPLLEGGGKGDLQWGDDLPFPAVAVDGFVADGQHVTVGKASLTAHLTPGHTKGCTTWTMPVVVDGGTRVAQFVCGASAPGYRLVGNPAYPDIVRDFRSTFVSLRTLPCDIFLGAHGSYYGLDEKRARRAAGSKLNPFVDPDGCRRYADIMEKRLDDQLMQERERLSVVAK